MEHLCHYISMISRWVVMPRLVGSYLQRKRLIRVKTRVIAVKSKFICE